MFISQLLSTPHLKDSTLMVVCIEYSITTTRVSAIHHDYKQQELVQHMLVDNSNFIALYPPLLFVFISKKYTALSNQGYIYYEYNIEAPRAVVHDIISPWLHVRPVSSVKEKRWAISITGGRIRICIASAAVTSKWTGHLILRQQLINPQFALIDTEWASFIPCGSWHKLGEYSWHLKYLTAKQQHVRDLYS